MTIRPIMIMTIRICINNKQTTPGAHKDAGWGKRSRVSWQVRSRTISPNWWEKGGNNHGFQLRFSQQDQIIPYIPLSNWFVVTWWVKESVPLVTAQGWPNPSWRFAGPIGAAGSVNCCKLNDSRGVHGRSHSWVRDVRANFESNYPTVFSQVPRYPRVLPPA